MLWNWNSTGILVPSDNEIILCPSGLIAPMTDTERKNKFFCSKYDCIVHCTVISRNGLHPTHIKDKKRRICKFCGKDDLETEFKDDCHAISALIGNKSLFLDNECADCNKSFGKLEDEFAKYLGATRTISQIIGKKGVPSYKKKDGTFRMDATNKRIVAQETKDSGNIEIFENCMGVPLVKGTFVKEAYVPIAAFKALVFMALSVMPENEFKVFETTIDWLREESHTDSKYNMDYYASRVIERFVSGLKPLPIQVWVVRRKQNIYDVPYCQFILEFDNYSFQIMIPCPEKDAVLFWTNPKNWIFPSTFDINEKEYRKFGSTELHVKDLSGKEKVKGEKLTCFMSGNGIKEIISLRGKTAQGVVDEYGVKALQPLKEKKSDTLIGDNRDETYMYLSVL